MFVLYMLLSVDESSIFNFQSSIFNLHLSLLLQLLEVLASVGVAVLVSLAEPADTLVLAAEHVVAAAEGVPRAVVGLHAGHGEDVVGLLVLVLALDHATGRPLYIAFVKNETTKDYEDAVQSVKERGYTIDGIIIDGKQSLFKSFAEYPIQMCQFHMKQITKRYLTKNPKLLAARALNALVDKLTRSEESVFKAELAAWKDEWHDMIDRRSIYKDGSTHYTHQRLRSAMHSLDFYMPYLFTYQRENCKGMPNTNNKIEGTFTDLKKNLNNHSGLTKENRKRFISGFFLALNNELQL